MSDKKFIRVSDDLAIRQGEVRLVLRSGVEGQFVLVAGIDRHLVAAPSIDHVLTMLQEPFIDAREALEHSKHEL